VLIGGNFQSVDGITRRGLARLSGSGTVDSGFVVDTGSVASIALQKDNKILIGGSLNTLNGIPDVITRLNADGSVDSSFVPAVALGFAKCVVIQPDDKVLIGGVFSTVVGNRTNRTLISRLNTDGSLDPTFDAGLVLDGPSGPYVSSIALQPNGKMIVGGDSLGLLYFQVFLSQNGDGQPMASHDSTSMAR
jgi:uncharacterized delta-60 repeat protein